jgi:hypothetical protein
MARLVCVTVTLLTRAAAQDLYEPNLGTPALRGAVSSISGINVADEWSTALEPTDFNLTLGDPKNFFDEMGSKKYRCGTEGYDKTRKSMQAKFVSACKKEKCNKHETAIVIAMASQESDKMDKTDTSKGSSSASSNWSPFNMNMDQLELLGCDKTCAKSLGQSASHYNIDKAVHYVVKGIRGGTKIGGTCDFMNFHRDGRTGWKTCLHKSCKCDCGSKGCKAYKDATADGAHQIADNKWDFTGGKRYCESLAHIR